MASTPSFATPSRGSRRAALQPRAAALVTLVALGAAASAQEQSPPVFRSEVQIATVYAAVLDDGEPVIGLTADDFRILENGRERPISVFLAPGDTPLDIALVLDYSNSMEGKNASQEALALLDGLDQRDCVLFVPFADSVGRPIWGAPDDPRLRRIIAETPLGGLTSLYDGMIAGHAAMLLRQRELDAAPPLESAAAAAADQFRFDRLYRQILQLLAAGEPRGGCAPTEPGQERRRVLMALTDGADTSSAANSAAVVLAGWRSGTPVYALANLRGRRRDQRDLVRRLQTIAEVSGGFVVSDGSLRRGYERIARLLRSYYVIGYRPTPVEAAGSGGTAPDWYEVEIRTRDRDYEVVAQKGRFSAADPARIEASLAAIEGLGLSQSASPERSLEQIDRALSLDPELAPAWYGRGLALTRLERRDEAVDAFEATLRLAPWIIEANGWLARLHAQAGRYDRAWHHGIRAAQGGGSADRFFAALRELSSGPADLDAQLGAPRVYLQRPIAPDLPSQLEMERVLAAIGNAVSESAGLGLVAYSSAADLRAIIRIDEIKDHPTRRLESKIRFYDRIGRELGDHDLDCDSIDEPASVAACASRVVAWMERIEIPRYAR